MDNELDVPPVEIKTKSPKRNVWLSNKAFSILAVLISMGTFILFAYQNHLITKQQYRSVLPYLMVNLADKIGHEHMLSLQVYNNGVGPAFIESINIMYKGKSYNSVGEFFLNGVYAVKPINCSRTNLQEGYVIPVGQPIDFLTTNDSIAYKELSEIVKEIEIEVVYSSLYEEKWKAYFQKRAKPVKL